MIRISIQSRNQIELIDITTEVQEAIREAGIKNGWGMLFVPHTTAAVTINENADPDVVTDMIKALDKMVPLQGGYRHAEGNSAAHVKTSLVGSSEMLMIEEGRAVLGRWQGIYFCEFDGPRPRQVLFRTVSA
ncbi:MAG: secondary thiamine-phosphate synthase enzyme YjbQ [Thermodesulfobacteriota bacterium]|jgi:secondary thiamine-phosphate synthase enzyme|nr:secondary thiamine-phosphate synthase enzyme YjbQ [Thermodesulfobacteriota bacterium]